MITLDDVRRAQGVLAGHVQKTPMPKSDPFSDELGCNVFVKMENLHRTGSFKERGALNKLLSLTPEQRRTGVIAASAGNHAQGVAFHGSQLGIPTTIVMPLQSPLVKVSATRGYGAEVILHGETFDDAFAHARKLEQERGLVFVHPFDDALVIAGQGTMGLEIVADLPSVDVVIVAIGGGGLIAGSALALKSLKPSVRVIGVNMASIAGMKDALANGAPFTVPAARTISDGIAVRRVGQLTFELVKHYVDEVVTVDEEEVANAILQLLEKEKTVVEGAGAAPMAALLNRSLDVKGQNVVVCLGGGNINVNLVSRIIERGLMKDGRRMRVRVVVPDRPGSLAALLEQVAASQANVLEVHHERTAQRLGLAETEVSLVLETRGLAHIDELLARLTSAGFQPQPGVGGE